MPEVDRSYTDRKRQYSSWLNRLIVQNWFDVGLRAKMSVLVTIGLIGLMGTVVFLGVSTITQDTQHLITQYIKRVSILSGSMDSDLEQIEGLLAILSTQIDMGQPQASLQSWDPTIKSGFQAVQGVYVFDRNANLIAATSSLPGVDWKQVAALRDLASGLPHSVSLEGLPRPLAAVAVPVMRPPSQIPAGILAVVLDLSNPSIFPMDSPSGLRSLGTFQVVDQQGQILVSSHPERTLSSETMREITNRLFASGSPAAGNCPGCTVKQMTDTNTGTVIVYSPLEHAPWGVVFWHDPQELYAPIRQVAIQALALGILTLLGAGILVYITTRSVIKPLQMLTDATRQVGEVQFDSATIESVECNLSASLARKNARRDEIGILSDAFVTMCRQLNQSMEEIRLWNRELDTRVQARTQQLSVLNTVALTVNQSLNLNDILNRAVDEVCQLDGIDMVVIYLSNPSNAQLELMTYRGLSENAARIAQKVGLLDSSCGGVVEREKPIVVPDITPYHTQGAISLQQEHILAIIHVPLMTKGRVLGSLCVGSRGDQRFEEEAQKLLTAIGNQIAIAVENARLYAELQRKERVRSGLFKKVLAAQEDERKRIARELHDQVSQSLTALLYNAEGGLETNEQPAIQESLQHICTLTQSTLDNIHKLIYDLRPSMLDQLGLIAAVRWLANTRLKSVGTRVTVVALGEERSLDGEADFQRLSPEMEMALYRVIQEAINNIARHAAAHNVEINLELRENIVTVDVVDNGVGFDLAEISQAASRESDWIDTSQAENMAGLGILGMQERIELLGGTMDIFTSPGNGTHIHIQVPIQERILAHDPGAHSG